MSSHQNHGHYFKEATGWADDKFGLIEASKTRYQYAFFASLAVAAMLALAIAVMMPLKSIQTVAVHHYENGITTVDTEQFDASPKRRGQVESDIVRYVVNRESYDISSYRSQFELVHLLSNSTVVSEYEAEQKASNQNAPLNLLGTRFTRKVHVYSINFLDSEQLNEKASKKKKNHADVAEVVFSISDYDKQTGREAEKQYSALVSWRYLNPPSNAKERWQNFDGFEVTRYTRVQRNV